MLPDGGYGALLHKLAAGIEVRYHSPVVAIESRDDGSAGSAGELIRVVTMDEVHYGTRLEHEERRLLASPAALTPLLPLQVHKAEAVIVTVPLGVLKRTPDEGGIRFEPPLPPAHLSAISRLGFGLLNKVALFFPKVFWPHQTDFFGRTARDPKQRGRFFLFFNLHQSSGQPALLALIAGSAAQDLEKLDDDDVANEALDALRTMFGKVRRDGTRLGSAHGPMAHLPRLPALLQVPKPKKVIVTRWGDDEYAYGSYSHIQVGASGRDYHTLEQPVNHRLYFAGEHTIEEHPATVVGAHLSGLRAARKVHKRYQTTLSQGSGASPDGAAASSSANGGGRARR